MDVKCHWAVIYRSSPRCSMRLKSGLWLGQVHWVWVIFMLEGKPLPQSEILSDCKWSYSDPCYSSMHPPPCFTVGIESLKCWAMPGFLVLISCFSWLESFFRWLLVNSKQPECVSDHYIRMMETTVVFWTSVPFLWAVLQDNAVSVLCAIPLISWHVVCHSMHLDAELYIHKHLFPNCVRSTEFTISEFWLSCRINGKWAPQ